MSRRDIETRFDDIVAFAELEQFIDEQVKHYSSGMYVRLGFAVAINVDPEILLVDEVLAVGDEAFQRKCIDKVRSFQAENRTIVVVTHAADLVRQMCHRAAALDHGKLVIEGDPNEVIRTFRERLMSGITSGAEVDRALATSELSPVWGKVRIVEADVVYASNGRPNAQPGEPMRIDVVLEAPAPVEDVVIGIAVYSSMGQLVYGTNTDILGADLGAIVGRRTVSFRFADVPLLDGTYALTFGVHTRGGLNYDQWEARRHFEVAAPGRDVGLVRLPVEIVVDGDP
jgi:ABC-2 type transport system ATP-binding protein